MRSISRGDDPVDFDRRRADHTAANAVWRRNRARGPVQHVGRHRGLLCHHLRRQRLRAAARAQAAALLGDHGQLWLVRHLPDDAGHLRAGRAVLAAVRPRPPAGRRPWSFQLWRPNSADGGAAD